LWTPPVGIRNNIVRKINLLSKSLWGGVSHTIALLPLVMDILNCERHPFQSPILVFTSFNARHSTSESGDHHVILGLDY
jgi:hypothetical protein